MAKVLSGMRTYWSVAALSDGTVLGEVDLVAAAPCSKTYLTAVEFKSSLRNWSRALAQLERAKVVLSLFKMWLESAHAAVLGWSYSVVVRDETSPVADQRLRQAGVAVHRLADILRGGKSTFFRKAVWRSADELKSIRAVGRGEKKGVGVKRGIRITVADFLSERAGAFRVENQSTA